MDLKQYVKKVIEEAGANEYVQFEIRLNSRGLVDDNGAAIVRFNVKRPGKASAIPDPETLRAEVENTIGKTKERKRRNGSGQ